MLSPITGTTRVDERGAHFIGSSLFFRNSSLLFADLALDVASVPTIGDTLQALEFISADISATLRQISDLSAELANKDHIVVDGVTEILRGVHATLLQELDIEQKRSLICQEIERVRQRATTTARALFGMLLCPLSHANS